MQGFVKTDPRMSRMKGLDAASSARHQPQSLLELDRARQMKGSNALERIGTGPSVSEQSLCRIGVFVRWESAHSCMSSSDSLDGMNGRGKSKAQVCLVLAIRHSGD